MQIVYIFFVRLVYDFLIIFIHANCKVDFLSGFFFILKKIVFIKKNHWSKTRFRKKQNSNSD